MKLNKLRTRFSYHKKKIHDDESGDEKMQATQVCILFYTFCKNFFVFAEEKKNVSLQIGE